MSTTSANDPRDTSERASESETAGSQPVPQRSAPRPATWSNDELIPFGKYILLNKLSAGATAAVYRAKLRAEPGFERIVTIKRILPQMAGDSEFVETFVEEAKLCARLAHGNICPIYELGKVGESLYMALQWVAGKDLGAIIRRIAASGQTMQPTAAAWIASRLCDALDYAHSMKDASGKPLSIIHQDLSPANIVVSYEGEVKLLDFGIARATGRAQQTNVDALKQKLGYMSPELVHGAALDARSDVFGIGVCLFEMVTGQRLFAGADDIATLKLVSAASIRAPSTVRDGIPPALEAIILRALAREPEGRWSSAGELASALTEYVASTDASFGTRNLAELMHGLFDADMMAEQLRLHELVTASQDPQLIEQRRRFFASPLGAAAVAKAEAARRAKTSAPPAPVPQRSAPHPRAAAAQSAPGATTSYSAAGPTEDDDAVTRYHAPLRPATVPDAAQSADDDEPTSFLADGNVGQLVNALNTANASNTADAPHQASPARARQPQRSARAHAQPARKPAAQPSATSTAPLPALQPMAAASRPLAPLGAGATIPGIAPQNATESGPRSRTSESAPTDDSALAVIAKTQEVGQFEEQATQIFFSHVHGFGLPDVPAEEELSPSVPGPLRVSGPSASAAASIVSTRPKTRPPMPPPAPMREGRTGEHSVPSQSASIELRPNATVSAGVTQRVKRRYSIAPNQATQRLKPLKNPGSASVAPPNTAASQATSAATPMTNLPTLQLSAAAAARRKLSWLLGGSLLVMASLAFTHQSVGIALGLRKPPHGVLEIRTAPDVSASIRIDGTYRGRAPMRLEDIPAGSRVLELEAEGYERVSRLIAIEGGAVVTENVHLNLQNAAAAVR